MKALIAWLITVEDLANIFYSEAAAWFKQDVEFAGFLAHLAEDEAWHSRVMVRAAEFAKGASLPPSAITLDEATKRKIEEPLLAGRTKLQQGQCTKEMLLGSIVAAEYSEWNDIFLYVVNTLKEHGREFADAASKIQQHKKYMERFLSSLPEGAAHIEQIRRLPAVWQEKILIVEDYAVLREFFRDVLSTEGTVVTAVNGKEGLALASQQHFDIILSDVQMPVMGGVEFYCQASRSDPGLRERFIFLTGDPTPACLDFFRRNNLRYFVKPVTVRELEEAVHTIVRRTRAA